MMFHSLTMWSIIANFLLGADPFHYVQYLSIMIINLTMWISSHVNINYTVNLPRPAAYSEKPHCCDVVPKNAYFLEYNPYLYGTANTELLSLAELKRYTETLIWKDSAYGFPLRGN